MNFNEARTNMVLNQLRANRISNSDLVAIYEHMERENFYPEDLRHLSYSDILIQHSDGRFLLPPLTSANLIQSLGDIKNSHILEVGSSIGISTSVMSQLALSVDCIETSDVMLPIFRKNLSKDFFQCNLLPNTINDFFESDSLDLSKYSKIVINGSIDQEPNNIISRMNSEAVLVCIIDNEEFKHKIIKYIKSDESCSRLILDEAVTQYIYKYITEEPFIF
jgi:protein-L-isoaspartate(D-aspartate) O-methyltransferase|tara:strand:+ start:53 stop:715 length:663 start_codon:yes stop_codon:yes gene_type:complete